MPTTTNFSLRYPDDSDVVDIAGHFANLATDTDTSIFSRLALSGGTLTGDLTINKSAATLTINSSSNAYILLQGAASNVSGIDFRTSTSRRWIAAKTSATESGSNAGSDFVLEAYSDAGSSLGSSLTITRSSHAASFIGDLTVSKASPTLTVSASSGNAALRIRGNSTSAAEIYLSNTSNNSRWAIGKDGTAESGSDAGSNFNIYRYNDAGSTLATALTIVRATGATTLTGNLTISKSSPTINVSGSGASYIYSNSTDSTAYLLATAPAGQTSALRLGNNAANRWFVSKNNASESGSNAGSNFTIDAYNDAGSLIGTALQITRSSLASTLYGDLTVSKASALFNLNSSSGAAVMSTSAPASNAINWYFNTAGVARWIIQKSGTAESGSNAGSDFAILAYNDAGSLIGTALTITRSTMAATFAGDVTITKTTPSVIVNASASGQESMTVFQTSGVDRWRIGKNLATESGSDGGSNFTIRAYSDAGALLSTPVTIWRGSGAVTFSGKVTTTHSSGFELGSSGPRSMAGTGSPEGVVTAPVGSIWYQSDSTVGVTHWRKASGSGNTGWVVMAGDTGWRVCTVADTSVLTNATYNTANPNSKVYVRRVGNTVELSFQAGASATFTTAYQTVYSAPSGFRPTTTGAPPPFAVLMNSATAVATTATLYASGTAFLTSNGWSSGINYWGYAVYSTTDAWPTSLPGSTA